MKQTTLLFILLFCAATYGEAQTAVPLQYQEMAQRLSGQVSKQINATPELQEESSVSRRMLDFAKSMLGIRYRTASSSPSRGFDCSGFVNYVFSNFGFKVPRSSREFASSGETRKLEDAKIGDVIVFTGTNSKIRKPGHVGIIYSVEQDEIKFIHSSSGGAKGVIITSLNEGFYKKRFLKIVSLL